MDSLGFLKGPQGLISLLYAIIKDSQVFVLWRRLMKTRFSVPLPPFIILIVFLVEIFIWLVVKPSQSGLVLLLLAGILVSGTLYLKFYFFKPSVCSLFRFLPRGESERIICGGKSVGSIVADYYECGRHIKQRKCFCDWHDPENGWMKKWLEKEDIKIYPSTIKRFPVTDDNDNGGPDLTLYFL